MQIFQWEYSPGFWPTLATMLLLPMFISLGFWQLDRADQKQDLYDQQLTELQKDAVFISQFKQQQITNEKQKKIKIKGQFHERYQILLDNQSHGGRVGYMVFYPFNLLETEQWVLVNLGWVAAGMDRSQIPELERFAGELEITGLLKKAPFTGIKLNETKAEKLSEDVIRLQRIEFEALSDLLGLDLQKKILQLDPGANIGYVREWKIPGSGKEKNLAYAFQWFLFALVLLIIHLYLNIKRKE